MSSYLFEMDRVKLFYRFQFDDNRFFNKNITDKSLFDSMFFVKHIYRMLPLKF